MKAEVRAFVYTDFDAATWWPEIEDDFGFWLDVYVGPVGGEGHEPFGVRVCTPAWLMRQHARDDVIVGWGTVLVNHYDPVALQQAIRRFVAQWEAPTWRELALRVASLGAWEVDEHRGSRADVCSAAST